MEHRTKSSLKFLFLLFSFALILPNYLEAATATEKSKNWKIKFKTAWIYESNLIGAPTGGTPRTAGIALKTAKDNAVNWDLTADYKKKYDDKTTFKFNYDINQTNYSDNSEYNITTQFFSAGVTRKINRLTNFQFNYKYIYNIVDKDDFSGIHYINPVLNHMHPKFGLTRLDYLYKNTNNWQFDSRDTVQNSVGLMQYVFFSNFTRRVGIGYRFAKDDANGFLAFSRFVHDFKLSLRTPLAYEINLNAKVKFSIRDYTNRPRLAGAAGTDTREDNIQTYSLKLNKVILKKWKCLQNLIVEASYRHNFNNSNEFLRNTKNNIYQLGLTAKF